MIGLIIYILLNLPSMLVNRYFAGAPVEFDAKLFAWGAVALLFGSGWLNHNVFQINY